MAVVNEPDLPYAIRHGFLFVNTAEMRISPELILAELFREVFYDRPSDPGGSKDQALNPDDLFESNVIDVYAYAALYATRGRKKIRKNEKATAFFAPLYPEVAKYTSQRRQSARVVMSFLLGGPIAQRTGERSGNEKDTLREKISSVLVDSLVGSNRPSSADTRDADIAAVMLSGLGDATDADEAKQRVIQKIKQHHAVFGTVQDDPLAKEICDDLLEVLGLEEKMPRFEWLRIVMGYLRLVIPLWMLAHMRLTVLARNWLCQVLNGNEVPSSHEIREEILHRYERVLLPTLTASHSVQRQIEEYMRCRVELSLLVGRIDAVTELGLAENVVLTTSDDRRGEMSLERLLQTARTERQTIMAEDDAIRDVETWVGHAASQYPAWAKPLKRGQGKNIDELVRVLYKANEGDQGGSYLLVRERVPGQRKQGFRVFPGPRLLQLLVHLAAQRKKSIEGSGPLVLSDLEEHLARYGIDFRDTADARPHLLHELARSGLLAGSPDAGVSARVRDPYARM